MSQRRIPFLNLTKLFEEHRAEFTQAIEGVIARSAFIGGQELADFEREFAAWVGAGYTCVGCGNGTDAITLAAGALGLTPGAEAIVPAMTFVATVEGLRHAGFQIRLVDVTPGDWLVDCDLLEAAITEKTKLLVPVHLYGQMAAMDRIRSIADRNGCRVLEDSAQAHGAKWKGKPVGEWSDAATYSFFPGKNLGAFGDAGGILSRDRALIERCSAVGKHGGLKKYEHLYLGYNSRLDTIQAAVLRVKLKYLDQWNEARRRVATAYREGLGGISGLELPLERPEAKHVYHLFVVQVDNRDAFREHLSARGVETGIHYPLAIHQLPAFHGESFAARGFPNAERCAARGVSLPMCPTLTASEVAYVIDAVRSCFK